MPLTTPELLKAYTQLTELKSADDAWLSGAIIPVAEGILLNEMGPVLQSAVDLPDDRVVLAVNMIAEFLFQQRSPAMRNVMATTAFKSETIGSYSYSLRDGASFTTLEWEQLEWQIRALLGDLLSADSDEIATAGGLQVFGDVRKTPWPRGGIDVADEAGGPAERIWR